MRNRDPDDASARDEFVFEVDYQLGGRYRIGWVSKCRGIPPDSYRLIVDAGRDRLAAAFTAIAEAPAGGVVVHCHAGRDRTGLVVALALHVAGASVESIAVDYALSDNSLPAMIVNTFAHLETRYGGVADYLVGSGVAPAHLAAVRARLT
jgi:protein-tyrosine phosphatase